MSKYIKQYEARINAILLLVANLFNDGSITRDQVDQLVDSINALILFLEPAIKLANKGNQKYPPKLLLF